MPRRVDYQRIAEPAVKALQEIERYVRASSLERSLVHLIKLRASQINGCAYCVDMHSKEARHGGESEQRLYALAVWRDAPFFSARERAAFEWVEAVTRIAEGFSESELERARAQFSESELVELTVATIAINAWNRLAVTLGQDVGSYQPPRESSSASAGVGMANS
jgi:AhpD family alkylhydroperoxidase